MKFKKNVLASSYGMLASCLVCASATTADAAANDKFQNAPTAARQVFGRISAAVPRIADSNGEIPAGDLVADAQLMATQPANLGYAQIALVNPSALGNGLSGKLYPHDISYNELRALQPQGVALITMSLTAQQLKYVLEQQFVGCGTQTRQSILQVSNGFSFSWKSEGGTCSKIWDVKLMHIDFSRRQPAPSGTTDVIVSGGVVLNPEKNYRVTVNESLAKGADNFSLLKDGFSPTEGVNDIDALADYLENFNPPKPSYDPSGDSLNKPRIMQLPTP